jgi:cysteinyl-tRNA synthetase
MVRPLSTQLYNTLSRRLEPITPAEEGHIRVYCCGPTTYDVSHAGHGRTAVMPDLLVRHLRASNLRVTYARNITDVEDKILRRSRERNEEPLALSERYAKMYQEDVARLGCLPPDHEPRVSECIGDIVAIIQKLIALGSAYEVETATGKDVWYAVRSFEGYGKLSGRSLDDLRSGEGLEERGKTTHTDKRDPLDFALWKSAPEGEWAFESPWGRGRPGWHIECSAMCERFLGHGFDIHAGGMDLIFPHHENEIAQSEAARPGEGPLCHHWIHGGFLTIDKEKMAKSLGNFVTMRDCYARNDPEALRYFYLTAHYRGPIEFETHKLPTGRVVFPGLDEAESMTDYLYATAERLDQLAAQTPEGAEGGVKDLAKIAQVVRSARGRGAEALDDDLNTPVALAVLQELAKASNELCDKAPKRRKEVKFFGAATLLAREALAAFRSATQVLGLLQSAPAEYAARTRARRLEVLGLDAAVIDRQIAERAEARVAKEFARSDAIRAGLEALGVEIYDGPAGTTWRIVMRREAPPTEVAAPAVSPPASS